jgi:hypothetical protein
LRVWIDGKLVTFNQESETLELSSSDIGGNTHLTLMVKTGLEKNVEHTLKIEPVLADGQEQELRIESICVAGPDAKVFE